MMGDLPSVIGSYRVMRLLGEGGMGAVYEAVHEVIKRRVAIKVLHPDAGRSADAINRFINEARSANLVNHPGLVQITDFGSLPDGAGYLVMEYLEGETLAGRLESSGGKLPPEEVVHIGSQIASALAAVHKKGITHRDLKPNNAMLVPDPGMVTGERVKVLDFGLAKLSEVLEAALVNTNSQAVMGTPLYMSPEQCEGAGRVDAKTDVYALGCMLYELLAGEPPFMGEGTGQVLGKHMFKEPEPLRKRVASTPAPLAELVHKLLIKSKDERPTMREAQRALEALAAELPPPQPRAGLVDPSGALPPEKISALAMASTLGEGAVEKTSLMAKQWRGKLIAGALAVLALVGGLTAFTYRRASAPAAPTIQAPPVPKSVTTRVESEPPGALVIRVADGQILGKTPWQQQSEMQQGKLELTLQLTGYHDQLLALNLSADDRAHVALIEQSNPAASEKPTSRAHSDKRSLYKRATAPIKKLAGQLKDKLTGKPVDKKDSTSTSKKTSEKSPAKHKSASRP